ncbi:uncharacterized protein LOC113505083 isoform X1 [Trichoplusia ni]|uniref:Uncharacterized protein LOC113505083 isoform X1 n=2 Tax=Trichoplusia ni TaxID=7111 RepID=A0A7E5WRK0_TRINI|nr:uncharacterized protein LOC113505083 isoform X1 [Trichoplusia ni]
MVNKSIPILAKMTNRPTYSQIECLVEFLEQNPGIAKGLLRTSQAKLETKRKWASLATSLNSIGGANKDGQGWAKYWAEKKCGLKKQCAQLSSSMRRTGGGTADNLPTLSALDKRLVAVMGGQEFATGNSSLAVNPFPELPRSVGTEPQVVEEEVSHHDVMEMQFEQPVHVSPILGTSHSEIIPETIIPVTTPLQITPPLSNNPPRRRRRSLTQRQDTVTMERFAMMEERRIEAETTTAQALVQLSQQIGNIARALTSIATAISDVARKMPEP